MHDDIFGLTCGASKQLSFPIMKLSTFECDEEINSANAMGAWPLLG